MATNEYTRIIEHKHFEYGTQPKTVITREYPATWKHGDEPYYPINNERNDALFAEYKIINLLNKRKKAQSSDNRGLCLFFISIFIFFNFSMCSLLFIIAILLHEMVRNLLHILFLHGYMFIFRHMAPP